MCEVLKVVFAMTINIDTSYKGLLLSLSYGLFIQVTSFHEFYA